MSEWVDVGLIAAIASKFALDYWTGRGAARKGNELREDTQLIRKRLHDLSNRMNTDLGKLSNRVTRLEKFEENVAERLERMEDKIDRLLENRGAPRSG